MLLRPTTRCLRSTRYGRAYSSKFRDEIEESSEAKRLDRDGRTFHLRPWIGLPTMAHVFAIVREVEQRYGRLETFWAPRSPDVPSAYMGYIVATFADPESTKELQEQGKSGVIIQVNSPPTDIQVPDYVGLQELQDYLDPGGEETDAASGSETREQSQFDVRIEQSTSGFRIPRLREIRPLPMHVQHNIGSAFVEFGGFSDPHPLGALESEEKTPLQKLVQAWWRRLPNEERDGYVRQMYKEERTRIEGQAASLDSSKPSAPKKPNVSQLQDFWFRQHASHAARSAVLEKGKDGDKDGGVPYSRPPIQAKSSPNPSPAPKSAVSEMVSDELKEPEPDIPLPVKTTRRERLLLAAQKSGEAEALGVNKEAEARGRAQEVEAQRLVQEAEARRVAREAEAVLMAARTEASEMVSEEQKRPEGPQLHKLSKREKLLQAARKAGEVDALKAQETKTEEKEDETKMRGARAWWWKLTNSIRK